MPKATAPKTPKPDDPEQSKRFIEAAKELGCDDSGEAFDRAFTQIVPPKVPSQDRSGASGPQEDESR